MIEGGRLPQYGLVCLVIISQGITIGPQLPNGKFVIIIGTDNDMSVSQNSANTQFDQCFR